MNPPVAPQPVKEEKSNTWKWLLLGCFGFIVLGGGMAAFMGWQMYKSFSMKPEEVEAAAQNMLPFEKPEGFEGKFSMSMMGVKIAALGPHGTGNDNAGMIMLTTMPGGKNNQDALRKSMNDNIEKQKAGKDISSQKLPGETFKVRGVNVAAEVQKLTPNQGGNATLQYTLPVTGPKGDLVLVLIQGPEATATHAWVQKFLDTVK